MKHESCAIDEDSPSEYRNDVSYITDGGSQLNVYDWLANIPMPSNYQTFNIIEIKFKGGRKDFYLNPEKIHLKKADIVVVSTNGGYDIGHVSLNGELVRLQLKKYAVRPEDVVKNIHRKATPRDIEKWEIAKSLESETMYKSRVLAKGLNLKMKICDVDYQGDQTKATFYYTADRRVDFREFILVLAKTFCVKIVMRQISVLEEASRLGGIGPCGREFCYSTWLTDFKQSPTLSTKKKDRRWTEFKCCLTKDPQNYTVSLKDQDLNSIKTIKGTARLQKTDTEKKIMWFSYTNDSSLIPVKIERVKEIQKLIQEGMILKDLMEEAAIVKEYNCLKVPDYVNVVGQYKITRFDKKRK